MINHFQAPFFVSPSSALQVIKGTGGGESDTDLGTRKVAWLVT